MVTLTHSSIETSLIATTVWDASYTPTTEDKVPVDIPVDLDIEVTVLPSNGSTSEDQLCSDTKNLYEQFDPANIKTAHSRSASQFYKVVRADHEREGLELQKPERIYDVCTPSNQPLRTRIPSTESSDSDRQSPARFLSSAVPKEKPPAVPERSHVQSANGESSKQLLQTQAEIRSLKALVDRVSDSTNKQITALKADVVRAGLVADKLSKQLVKVQSEMTVLQGQVTALSVPSSGVSDNAGQGRKAVSAEVQEQNRQRLTTYSHSQVHMFTQKDIERKCNYIENNLTLPF